MTQGNVSIRNANEQDRDSILLFALFLVGTGMMTMGLGVHGDPVGDSRTQ